MCFEGAWEDLSSLSKISCCTLDSSIFRVLRFVLKDEYCYVLLLSLIGLWEDLQFMSEYSDWYTYLLGIPQFRALTGLTLKPPRPR